jgi:hypothetical protein
VARHQGRQAASAGRRSLTSNDISGRQTMSGYCCGNICMACNRTSSKAVGYSTRRCLELLRSFLTPDAFGCAASHENAATAVATAILQTDMVGRSWVSGMVGRSRIRGRPRVRRRGGPGPNYHSLAERVCKLSKTNLQT